MTGSPHGQVPTAHRQNRPSVLSACPCPSPALLLCTFREARRAHSQKLNNRDGGRVALQQLAGSFLKPLDSCGRKCTGSHTTVQMRPGNLFYTSLYTQKAERQRARIHQFPHSPVACNSPITQSGCPMWVPPGCALGSRDQAEGCETNPGTPTGDGIIARHRLRLCGGRR